MYFVPGVLFNIIIRRMKMVDEVQPTQPAQVGEQQSETVAQGAGQLTPETVQGLIQQGVKAAMEEIRRTEQSQRDKLEARIRRETEQRLAAMKAAGIEVTDDQRKAVETVTRKQIAEPVEEPDNDPISEAASAMMDKAGVEILESDPEAALMKAARSPEEYLAATKKAIALKKARDGGAKATIKPQAEPETPEPQDNPASRVVQTGTGGPGAGKEALTRELMDLLAHPKKENLPRIRELREKLMK